MRRCPNSRLNIHLVVQRRRGHAADVDLKIISIVVLLDFFQLPVVQIPHFGRIQGLHRETVVRLKVYRKRVFHGFSVVRWRELAHLKARVAFRIDWKVIGPAIVIVFVPCLLDHLRVHKLVFLVLRDVWRELPFFGIEFRRLLFDSLHHGLRLFAAEEAATTLGGTGRLIPLKQFEILHVNLKHGPAHLEVVVFVLLQEVRLSDLDKGSEFGLVVFYEVVALIVSVDFCVVTGHRDISHANVSVVSPSNSYIAAVAHAYHVDDPDVL